MTRSRASAIRIVSNAEAHGDALHPACACGCGDPLPMRQSGFGKYVNSAHSDWANAMCRRAAGRPPLVDGIPIEKFRDAVRKLKEAKGLTYAQLAEAGGQQAGWLNNYMYGTRYQNIGRDTATAFLRRLAGYPSEPTRYERALAERRVKQTSLAIKGIGMDAPKNTYVPPHFLDMDTSKQKESA